MQYNLPIHYTIPYNDVRLARWITGVMCCVNAICMSEIGEKQRERDSYVTLAIRGIGYPTLN